MGMSNESYRQHCDWRDELNNHKIKSLGLENILIVDFDETVQKPRPKLAVRSSNGVSLFVAEDRDLAEAFILGVYTGRQLA